MQFSLLMISAFAALTIAAPVKNNAMKKRAVFGATTYDAISISGGTAGNALEEANAILDKLPATPDEADLDFLNEVNQVANDVEKEGFNTAIAAATGEEADALSRGKIKNKVLKLQATVLKLTASGKDAAKLAEEQKKLANNVALDAAEAGAASTAVTFDATLGSGTAAADGAAADEAATDEAATDADADADEATTDEAATDADADADEAATDEAATDEAATDEAATDADADADEAATEKASKKADKAAAKADNKRQVRNARFFRV